MSEVIKEEDKTARNPRIQFKDAYFIHEPQAAIREASKISIKVDLLEAALSHVELLEDFDKHPCLYEGEILHRAIRRYEELWLPLAADHEQERLAAPLDIEWIWHCHLLSPMEYEKDCMKLFKKVINHKMFRRKDRDRVLKRSRHLWEKRYPDEDFILELPKCNRKSGVIHEKYKSRIGYNLVAAAGRQGAFHYNVSLSHWFDMKYLSRCVARYKMFLFLRNNSKDCFLVPCYDIDLMWHTHQLHPHIYKKDTIRILGYFFNHDDTTTDRNPGSKLSVAYAETRKLWKEMYGHDYSNSGAMYRGIAPRDILSDYQVRKANERDTITPTVILSFDSITLDRVPDGDDGFCFTIDISLCTDSKEVQTMTLQAPYLIWSKEDMKPIMVQNLEKSTIRFRLLLKTGKVFTKNTVLCQKTLDLNFSKKRPSSITMFMESISLEGIENNMLHVHGQIENIFPVKQYEMEHGDFQMIDFPEDIDAPVWSTRSEDSSCKDCNSCYFSECRFIHDNEETDLSCKVLHSAHRNMTVIQFMQGSKQIICSVKLIDSAHLPLPSQVSDPDRILTLDPSLRERAFLIRDSVCDWGIVTGWWGKGNLDEREIMHYAFYRCADGKIQRVTPTVQDGSYSIKVDQCTVDIEGAIFKMTCSPQEVPHYLAFGMAVGLLHGFCIPRPFDWITGKNVKMDRTSPLDLDDMKLLVGCGLHVESPSNHYRFQRKNCVLS